MNRIRFSALDSNKLAGIAKSHRHNYKKKEQEFLKFVFMKKCKVTLFCLSFWRKIDKKIDKCIDMLLYQILPVNSFTKC